MERGYVKLWRSIDQNELLENDNTAFIVFMKLLTRVNRMNGTYTTGRKKLANICNLNPNTLYSALKRLEASTIIQQQSNKVSTTITICNWWKYQQDDNKSSSRRQSAGNTIQEKKEKKEIYKEKRNHGGYKTPQELGMPELLGGDTYDISARVDRRQSAISAP